MNGRPAFIRWYQRLPVEPVFQDRFDVFIGIGPDGYRPLAGLFKTLKGRAFTQAHHPQAGPEALFRMRSALHDHSDHLFGIGPRFPGPVDDP